MTRSFVVCSFAICAVLTPADAMAGGSMTSGLSNAGHELQKPTCSKGDPVVWLDTKLNVYFPETSPYYGKTYHGEWNCMSDAVKSGARLTKYVNSTSPAPATAASAAPSSAPAAPAAVSSSPTP